MKCCIYNFKKYYLLFFYVKVLFSHKDVKGIFFVRMILSVRRFNEEKIVLKKLTADFCF